MADEDEGKLVLESKEGESIKEAFKRADQASLDKSYAESSLVSRGAEPEKAHSFVKEKFKFNIPWKEQKTEFIKTAENEEIIAVSQPLKTKTFFKGKTKEYEMEPSGEELLQEANTKAQMMTDNTIGRQDASILLGTGEPSYMEEAQERANKRAIPESQIPEMFLEKPSLKERLEGFREKRKTSASNIQLQTSIASAKGLFGGFVSSGKELGGKIKRKTYKEFESFYGAPEQYLVTGIKKGKKVTMAFETREQAEKKLKSDEWNRIIGEGMIPELTHKKSSVRQMFVHHAESPAQRMYLQMVSGTGGAQPKYKEMVELGRRAYESEERKVYQRAYRDWSRALVGKKYGFKVKRGKTGRTFMQWTPKKKQPKSLGGLLFGIPSTSSEMKTIKPKGVKTRIAPIQSNFGLPIFNERIPRDRDMGIISSVGSTKAGMNSFGIMPTRGKARKSKGEDMFGLLPKGKKGGKFRFF